MTASTHPFPDFVRTVAVVALAGAPKPERVAAGAAVLENWGLKVKMAPSVTAGHADLTYLAAPDETRARDLERAWTDPEVDLILNVRGGYGSARMLPLLNWDLLRSRRLPFLGYSDLTALETAFLAKGVGDAFYTAVLTEYPALARDPFSLESLASSLAPSSSEPRSLPTLPGRRPRVIREGQASGPVLPATLSVLVTLLGTEYMPDPRGKVLFLEDVNEPVYKLDRYFTQLAHHGVLEQCAAVLLGGFPRCGNRHLRRALFASIADVVRGPVLSDYPFGHVFPRMTVRGGETVTIRGDVAVFSQTE